MRSANNGLESDAKLIPHSLIVILDFYRKSLTLEDSLGCRFVGAMLNE